MGKKSEKAEEKIITRKSSDGSDITWLSDGLSCPGVDSVGMKEKLLSFLKDYESKLDKKSLIRKTRNIIYKLSQHETDFLGCSIIVKRYKYRRMYDKLRFLIQESKALRSLENAGIMVSLGLKTPKPLAVLEKRTRLGFILHSYYVTECIDYDFTLKNLLAESESRQHPELKEYLKILARQVSTMHNNGLVYNDLHAENILIKNREGETDFFYVDLNRARVKKKLSRAQRIKDLSRLSLDQDKQRYFLSHYLQSDDEQWFKSLAKKRDNLLKRRNLKKSIRRIFGKK